MSLFKDLMNFAYDVTCAMLGLDPTANPQNILPLDYTESPSGLDDPHSDYAFYLVQFDDADINRQIDTEIEVLSPVTMNKKVKYVRNLRFIWQTYGDDGFEWADRIRIKLFDPDIQALFEDKGISLITDVPEPVYIPERIGQKWYKRYDLAAKFNQLVTVEESVSAVASAEIAIVDEEGVVGGCSISVQ